jgi:hypothetical protein
MMFAAAACTIAACNALAESYEAEIPFTFRAGRVRMAPGRYQVWIDEASAARMIRLHNVDSRETLLLLPASIAGAGDDSGSLTLRFHCGSARCALASISVSGSLAAYTFHTPALGGGETERVAVVPLTRVD